MDAEVRRHERDALSGDPAAILRWAHARRLAGEAVPAPRDGDRVRGELLGAVLIAALAGRREIEVLRQAGVAERRFAKLIDALRGLGRGEVMTWSTVREWVSLLAVDVDDVALLAEVVRFRRRRPPQSAPHPLDDLPERPCCGRCPSMRWVVAIGAGVRCASRESPLGPWGAIPTLRHVCPAYSGPAFPGQVATETTAQVPEDSGT